MCGIYLTNIPTEKQIVVSKLKSINFRGPDYLGVEQIDDLTFGHLRLAILDLDKRSNQPFTKDNLSIVFNGEIYNYKDIKQELITLNYSFTTESDTEVLLLGYKEWGEKILDKINGMFAFCIYNTKTKTVFCARDRIGVKPFYYYWKDGMFEICSQMRPLIKGRKINKEALEIYLDCRYVPSPYSIIENVFKLKPGHYLEINLEKKSIRTECYWDLTPVKTKNISYDQAKTELHDLLKDATKIRLQSDVPIGSFLSGGIDSALITSLANEVSENKINTFSIGFEDPEYDESSIARQFSEIIGANHKETICTSKDVLKLIPKLVEVYDEPFSDSSALPSLLLNSVTKEDVTVALSGDGGDESFLGYNHFAWVNKIKIFYKIPLVFRRAALLLPIYKLTKKPKTLINDLVSSKNINTFIQKIFIGFSPLLLKRDLSWFKHYEKYLNLAKNPIQKTADLNIKLWLENDSNVKVDRASMAYSVEVRSPLLDYRVIEFARSLPVSYRYANVRKLLLRDILKEYIPEKVFNQPKSGFSVPIDKWIRTDLKEEFLSVLDDKFLKKLPNFNINKFKKQLSLHMENKENHGNNIWKLYVLAKWYEEFNF